MGVHQMIRMVIDKYPGEAPVSPNCIISPYAPTPTIIEAARTLYENHSVENITRHEADKVSTDRTRVDKVYAERLPRLAHSCRMGMVICIPEGNGNKTATGFWEDSTRLPEYYDGTYQYLKSMGIEEI